LYDICEAFFGRAEISYDDWLRLVDKCVVDEVKRRVHEEMKWREELGKN
jgi:hypothetical protein